MRQKKKNTEKINKEIQQNTRRKFSSEEKINNSSPGKSPSV